MKYILGLSLFVFSLSLQARESMYSYAYQIQFGIELYNVTLDTLDDVSNHAASSEDERVERDLALCDFIGQSEQNRSFMTMALGAFINHHQDNKERAFLDVKHRDIARNNTRLRFFCYGSRKEAYRNIPYLKSAIKTLRRDFSDLKPIVDKYLQDPKN